MTATVLPARVGTRTPQRLLLALALGTTAVALALAIANRDATPDPTWGFRAFPALFALSFTIVGYVVATQRSQNRIGWLLLGLGAASGLQLLSEQYALDDAYGLARLPGAPLVAWFDGWIWVPEVTTALCVIPALFPDGRPLSKRWRALLWATAMVAALATLAFAFGPAALANTGLNNPLSIGRLGPDSPILIGSFVALTACGVASVASLGLRFRRAQGDEHEQLKWFTFAASLVALAFLLLIPTDQAKPVQVLLIMTIALVPVAIGIAILRYRLYEIDTLINRSLVYGALTALLAGVFVATQTLLQRLFVAATGSSSDLAVVLTLFVVATAIAPLRARLQVMVDRRFRAAAPAEPTQTAAAPVMQLLRELAELHSDGVLADDEFTAKKKELLGRI
jgi:hypothetical protein